MYEEGRIHGDNIVSLLLHGIAFVPAKSEQSSKYACILN